MTHEEIKDDLILFAAGTLDGADLEAVERHLPTCAECRAEVELMQTDFSNIRQAVVTTPAPTGARARLLREIRPESAVKTFPFFSAPKWALLPLAASLVFAAGVFVLARQNQKLEAEIAAINDQLVHSRQDRAQAEGILEALRSPEALRVTLSPSTAPVAQPRVDAVFSPRSGRLVVIASNLGRVPDDKAYQLWLLPKSGAPIPAGTFRPDQYGHAVYTLPSLEAGAVPTGFAVTIEAKQGSVTPTMPIVLVGKVG